MGADFSERDSILTNSLQTERSASGSDPSWRTNQRVKRVLDFIFALLLGFFLLPLMLIITCLVATDGGPVFFRHSRLGKSARDFPCLKFRSMLVNADEVLAKTLATDPESAAEWRATRKLRNDPRVTGVGRLLRKTSLDELPQILNVLRGDMSFVGPRPIVVAEIPYYGRDINLYYSIRPGITGLWQVSGRSNTSYPERVQLDSWYVSNWSFGLDFRILVKTIPVAIKGSGAV